MDMSCLSSINKHQYFVCFLLGNYPASGVYMPTFRNTLFHLPMKMEQTECSETSAYKLQTPGNYPKESIQHTEHGESLKSKSVSINTPPFHSKHQIALIRD